MTRSALTLSLAILCFAVTTFAGSDKAIDNLKMLGGDWRGGASAIHINEDGTYEGTAASGARTTGKVTLAGGKASFQSTTSAGTVTLSEENGNDVLTFVRSDGRGSATLQRVK